jgi:hypothetical protein
VVGQRLLRVRPEGTIGYEFWEKSGALDRPAMPYLAFEVKVRTFLSSLRDGSLLKPHPSTKVLGYFHEVPPGQLCSNTADSDLTLSSRVEATAFPRDLGGLVFSRE